jgi:hypothetical protein
MSSARCAELLIMGYYNEADTRAQLIDPKLQLAGWGEGQIEREHYFVKGQATLASFSIGFLARTKALAAGTFLSASRFSGVSRPSMASGS